MGRVGWRRQFRGAVADMMDKGLFRFFAAGASALVIGAAAGTAHAAPDGKAIFELRCAICHAAGSGHPGTIRLAQTRGTEFSVLTERSDLALDYVKQVVRQGLLEMPGFRPTEIGDAELDALAAYLAGKGK